jgi:hypothetical protein
MVLMGLWDETAKAADSERKTMCEISSTTTLGDCYFFRV